MSRSRPKSSKLDRLPPPRPKSAASATHERCIPKSFWPDLNQSPVADAYGRISAESKTGVDERVEDEIWKGSIIREKECAETWKKNWGFMVAEKEVPEHEFPVRDIKTPFSRRMPNTRARRELGSRNNTRPVGSVIVDWQLAWGAVHRKKKLDKDLVGY